jgi:hypothetical protein
MQPYQSSSLYSEGYAATFKAWRNLTVSGRGGHKIHSWAWSLKGHGNEADFLGFLQKLVPHESLTLTFEPFRFWLGIPGDIRFQKTTPRFH